MVRRRLGHRDDLDLRDPAPTPAATVHHFDRGDSRGELWVLVDETTGLAEDEICRER
jgi:hypothetical protein